MNRDVSHPDPTIDMQTQQHNLMGGLGYVGLFLCRASSQPTHPTTALMLK